MGSVGRESQAILDSSGSLSIGAFPETGLQNEHSHGSCADAVPASSTVAGAAVEV